MTVGRSRVAVGLPCNRGPVLLVLPIWTRGCASSHTFLSDVDSWLPTRPVRVVGLC